MLESLFERAVILRSKGYNSSVFVFSPKKNSKQNNNIIKRKNIILFDEERRDMLNTICMALSERHNGIPFQIFIDNFYLAKFSFFNDISQNKLGFLNIV